MKTIQILSLACLTFSSCSKAEDTPVNPPEQSAPKGEVSIQPAELKAYKDFLVAIRASLDLRTEGMVLMQQDAKISNYIAAKVSAASNDLLHLEELVKLVIATEAAHSAVLLPETSKAVEVSLDALAKSTVIMAGQLTHSLKIRDGLPKKYLDGESQAWTAICNLLKAASKREAQSPGQASKNRGFATTLELFEFALKKTSQN